MRRRWALLGVVIAMLSVGAVPAGAHTVPDFVAVPAGSEATLTLRPTHGCGDSPTVWLSIRAPVPNATAGEVEGWTTSSESDDEGRTVLTWSDGLLPADQAGEFGVTFMVPDAVGTLLLFPAVQVCENGEELAWISGDPESPHPAPRILVLPEGSEPASNIDEVPDDVPGRDQLVEIVDTDQPDPTTTTTLTTTTTPAETTTTTTATTTTTVPPVTTAEIDEEATETAVASSSFALPWVVAAAAVAALAGLLVFIRRRKS